MANGGVLAYFLCVLLGVMVAGVVWTTGTALGFFSTTLMHIPLAIATFLVTLLTEALVMFYTIGVHRMMVNIDEALKSPATIASLDIPSKDLRPYLKKTEKFVRDAKLCKRRCIPWAMLMITLGSLAFLLGAAHDTGLVARTTHSGVSYGFLMAMILGSIHQWRFLVLGHKLLRKAKALFDLPDEEM